MTQVTITADHRDRISRSVVPYCAESRPVSLFSLSRSTLEFQCDQDTQDCVAQPQSGVETRLWHQLASEVGRRFYVIEELVRLGEQKHWTQAAALEVVRGERGSGPNARRKLSQEFAAGRII